MLVISLKWQIMIEVLSAFFWNVEITMHGDDFQWEEMGCQLSRI